MTIEAQESRRAALLVAPALIWTAAFFILPFGAMIWLSLSSMQGRAIMPGPDFGNYIRIFTDPSLRQGLWNSLQITLAVTLISVVLAWPLAWIIAMRVPARWQRLALLLAVLPFWTSYVVRSYAWLLVLAPTGPLNSVLLAIGLIHTPLRLAYSTTATEIGFVHFLSCLIR